MAEHTSAVPTMAIAPRAWLALERSQRWALGALLALLGASTVVLLGSVGMGDPPNEGLVALIAATVCAGAGYVLGRRRERRFAARYMDEATGLLNAACLDRCYSALVRRRQSATALIAVDFSLPVAAASRTLADQELMFLAEGLKRCLAPADLAFFVTPSRFVVIADRAHPSEADALALMLRTRTRASLAPHLAASTHVVARPSFVGAPLGEPLAEPRRGGTCQRLSADARLPFRYVTRG